MSENKIPGLALYHFARCPYCVYVRDAIKDLGIEIEERDILQDREAEAELQAARGRTTVPVLRIEEDGKPAHWMPESRDIAAYLKDRFGK